MKEIFVRQSYSKITVVRSKSINTMSVFKSQKGKRKWEKKTLNYLMVNARDRSLCTQM